MQVLLLQFVILITAFADATHCYCWQCYSLLLLLRITPATKAGTHSFANAANVCNSLLCKCCWRLLQLLLPICAAGDANYFCCCGCFLSLLLLLLLIVLTPAAEAATQPCGDNSLCCGYCCLLLLEMLYSFLLVVIQLIPAANAAVHS